ncbi:ribonuclease HII [Lachnospiraceae bacterium 29-84]
MGTQKKIKTIQLELQAAEDTMLPSFISAYGSDTRSGVQKLVQKAQKRMEAVRSERERIETLKAYEKKYAHLGYLCGVDEAGRGPLAGPVVAGAVILPKDCQILYINDSKKLSAKKREELYEAIMEQAVAVGVGIAGPGRIDEINILQADYEAMRQAIQNLSVKPDILLNDAVTIPGIAIPQIPLIHGDAKSISIGAASIIAKVTRDRMMEGYDKLMPEYGFAKHKGYGTKEHIEAIREYGPSPIHRRSFLRSIQGSKPNTPQ